jgi:rubredoxin
VEYGACFWGLYVAEAVAKGKQELTSVPERRPPPEQRKASKQVAANLSNLPLPIWRCKVCGYLCARDGPPEICPICKAKKERFERFIWQICPEVLSLGIVWYLIIDYWIFNIIICLCL